MKVRLYMALPKESVEIRREVFVEEQGFQSEFDEVDEIAVHFVLFDDEEMPQATCRVFWDREKDAYVLGRVAVRKENRGKNFGKGLVDAAKKYLLKEGRDKLYVHAQCRAETFYKKVGFVPFGKVDEDEGVPHVWMKMQF